MSTSTTHAAVTAAPATPPRPRRSPQRSDGAQTAASGARRSAIGLGVVLVAQLMLVLDATVVNVALPHIQTDLGFTPAGLSWVLNAYTLAFGGLLLLGGRLGDVFGRLRTFEIGLAIFTVASLLGGLATPRPGSSRPGPSRASAPRSPRPSVLALVTTSAPNEAARNRGLALFTAVSSAGASIGLLLGGVLTDFVSWHWTLFVNVPIGAVVLVLARRFVTETPRVRVRFDVVGAVTATLGSVSVVHGFISAADRGWSAPITLASFAVGLAAAGDLRPHGGSRRRAAAAARPRPAALPGRSARAHGARRRRAVLDVLPRDAVPPARPRLQPGRHRRSVPPAQPRDLRDLAGERAPRGTGRAPAPAARRHPRAHRELRVAEQHHGDEHVCRPPPRRSRAQWRLGGARLHAGHGRRARRCRPQPRRAPSPVCCRRRSSSAVPSGSPRS